MMLGENVRSVRKSRGITLKELAEKNRSFYWVYFPDREGFNGSVAVNVKKAERGAGCADVPVYGRDGDGKRSDDPQKRSNYAVPAKLQYPVPFTDPNAVIRVCSPISGYPV